MISFEIITGFRRTPSPSLYATALLPLPQQTCESVYAKPESVCPSRISYYASSQLTQVIYFLNYHRMPSTSFTYM